MPGVAAKQFHAKPEMLVPVDELERIGDRPLRFELNDDRVERRVRNGVHCDELPVDVEFEVVVGDDVAGDHFTIGINLNDWHVGRGDVSRLMRGELIAFVKEVRTLEGCSLLAPV